MRKAERPLAIANLQRKARPRKGQILALVERVLGYEGRRGGIEVAFVGERTIRRLHRDWLDDDSVTDVISFPLGDPVPGPGAADVPIGEVVICVSVVERLARAARAPVHEEVARRLIHGILHVVGYDHDTPAKARRMGSRERIHLAWYRRRDMQIVGGAGFARPGR